MNDKHFKITQSSEEEIDWPNSQIDVFNKNQLGFTGKHLEVLKNYSIRNDDTIIAGINGCFYLGEILYINVLLVDENYRGKQLGSRLLQKIETEAKAAGAKLAHLDTFDFQAKDFYVKHGYEVFGVLEDCPEGHTRYYMKKVL